MKLEIPAVFQPLYSREEISKRVLEMASEIDAWAKAVFLRSAKDVVVIPVLRGGIFFFSDLVRALSSSVEVAPTQAWAYDPSRNSPASKVEIDTKQVEVQGRVVLLVDDICDSGRTLRDLKDFLLRQGASEARSAVLVKRELSAEIFEPEWVGFRYPGKEWFVGYGMDYYSRWRNLAEVYLVKESGQATHG